MEAVVLFVILCHHLEVKCQDYFIVNNQKCGAYYRKFGN